MIAVFNNYLITILIRNILLAYRRYQGTEVRNKDIPITNHLHETSEHPIQKISVAKWKAQSLVKRRQFSHPVKWLFKAFKVKWAFSDLPNSCISWTHNWITLLYSTCIQWEVLSFSNNCTQTFSAIALFLDLWSVMTFHNNELAG